MVSALFYIENSTLDELQKEIDIVVNLIKNENQQEISLFINWLRYIFTDDDENLIENFLEAKEVKSMFAAALKKYKKELIDLGIEKGLKKGIQKGARQKAFETAAALLKEQIPLEKIVRITGLSGKDIKSMS